MELQDARKLARHKVVLHWRDRKGDLRGETSYVYELRFVPLYGPCLITDFGEIAIDRIESVENMADAA